MADRGDGADRIAVAAEARIDADADSDPDPEKHGAHLMSRLRAFATALSVVVACGTSAQENLVANAGFEEAAPDGNSAPSWTQLRGEPVVFPADGGHAGARFARFQDGDPKAGVSLESEHVPARPGGVYRLSAWVRTSANCAPGIYIQFHDELGTRIHEVHRRQTGPTDGWVRYEANATAPEDAADASVLLYAYIGDVGGFDFDDVVFTVEGGREPGSAQFPPAEPGGKPAIDIGSRLELFVDDFLIDEMSGGVGRRLHHPDPREVALTFDAPWEGPTSIYVTVFQDGDRVRCYYRGSGREGRPEVACYAESTDGITFTKPSLGVVEIDGSTENNVVWTGKGSHNFTPFKDTNPTCASEHRYKAVAGGPLIALVSADGLRWEQLGDEPVITNGAFDSQNLAFWDAARGQYRDFHRRGRDGVRDVMTCTSDDFITWTEPVFIEYAPDTPKEHLYTNAITPYFRAPHILLGFPKRFVPNRKLVREHPHPGVSDGIVMSSRDGLHWDRWAEAFLRPGPDPKRWTERNNAIAWGMVPTSEEEISLYWVERYRHPGCRLRRGTVRTDGFVSVHAGGDGGELLTRPLRFAGSRLLVNFSTSAAGSVRFALCDEAGEPVGGFTMVQCPVLYGDKIEHEVRWKSDAELAALSNRPVRLRVRLKDADLFSFRFVE